MAGQTSIYIGTSGWSYPRGEGTWKGHFYPRGKVNELEYYGRFFNTVEVNSSFYRPPEAATARGWAQRVPPYFVFSIKLWQKFTHPGMYRSATGEEAAISCQDVETFKASLEPLAREGRLAALLAQFPPSFKNDAYGRQVLGAVIKAFNAFPLAVELRNKSWSDDVATARLLAAGNVAWVQVDEPKFRFSISGKLPQTSDMAYFRFHGRNREMWWRGDNETRYRYPYSKAEIEELAQKVAEASRQARETYAFFNNHWQGYAPQNAVQMKAALGLSVTELPVWETQTEPGADSA